jgi:hypothetical protein
MKIFCYDWQIFLDKRDNTEFDLLTVSETSAEPPQVQHSFLLYISVQIFNIFTNMEKGKDGETETSDM